jgi:uncharacterized glyoxalase superfamily protein PhnB
MAITPYLFYEDVDAALDFLAKAFGFRESSDRMRAPNGRTVHAAMKSGRDVIMMGRPPQEYRNPKHLGMATQCLYINVRNVDKHYERALKAGAAVVNKLETTPYGDRRYGVADPEGHQWYFAQRIRRGRRRKS